MLEQPADRSFAQAIRLISTAFSLDQLSFGDDALANAANKFRARAMRLIEQGTPPAAIAPAEDGF